MKRLSILLSLSTASLSSYGGSFEDLLAELRAKGANPRMVFRASAPQAMERDYAQVPMPENNPPRLYDDDPETRFVLSGGERSPGYKGLDVNPKLSGSFQANLDLEDTSTDDANIGRARSSIEKTLDGLIDNMPAMLNKGVALLTQADRIKAHQWLKDHLEEFCCRDRNHKRIYITEKALGIGQQDKHCDPRGYYGEPVAPWISSASSTSVTDEVLTPSRIIYLESTIMTKNEALNLLGDGESMEEVCMELSKDLTSSNPERVIQARSQMAELGCR